ncbi:CBS domain-containing protein [Streptomyces roseoverticillatus]|uniref:CBS domain-containing protein n=1 Tax=Streptomyces roseoverticillatus TaxID=66429 RepID=UPI001F38D377|nr:CBS domain-containing protein [Streptomyces roseoverticillatus]MCF3103189.1 CBS domain-containing protein [Streptomyces roseoverticillatus]
MQHRTVDELMTKKVVSVGPETPFKEIVKELAQNDVTAVPVVDAANRVVGVVSEGDLMCKSADQTDPFGRIPVPCLEAWERARAEGTRAEELMSVPAVCARPEWNVVEAARLMAVEGVRRLPVVDEADRLVGIVSRGDLLRIFLRDDRAIREEIVHDLLERTLGLAPSAVAADVTEGQVTLTGSVQDRSTIPVLVRLCRAVDGVVAVRQRIVQDEHAGDRTPRRRSP